MESIDNLMVELAGADPETVNRIAWEKGSLPVRLAMLGLASIKKGINPLWWGYPPGVFISYKWEGSYMHDLTKEFARYVRELGYQAYLDVENLDEDADAYFQIPQYISSLHECQIYVLLLTELGADLMTGRKGKTSWIHDEYQHAVRLTNEGRLILVPVLLEPNGLTDYFTLDKVIDLTRDQRAFEALNNILTPDPLALPKSEIEELRKTVAHFDETFLNQKWSESKEILQQSQHLDHTFDHQFRGMLHAIYTADQVGLDAALDKLYPIFGERLVYHIYQGYCQEHNIPNRMTVL